MKKMKNRWWLHIAVEMLQARVSGGTRGRWPWLGNFTSKRPELKWSPVIWNSIRLWILCWSMAKVDPARSSSSRIVGFCLGGLPSSMHSSPSGTFLTFLSTLDGYFWLREIFNRKFSSLDYSILDLFLAYSFCDDNWHTVFPKTIGIQSFRRQ